MNTKATVKIELTPEQQAQVRQALGKEISAVELAPEELEVRIAPAVGEKAEGSGKWYQLIGIAGR